MKLVTRFILAVSISAAAMLLHAKELPQGEVCVQMEEAGDRLLAGEAGDFFFIETAGTQFPVPSFFLIASPSEDNVITIEASPSTATTRSARIRESTNGCEWDFAAKIGGSLEQMYERFETPKGKGGEAEFREKIDELYQAGHMSVALRKTEIGTHSVTAWSEDGFITFYTRNPERVYWLINLAAKLSEGDSE